MISSHIAQRALLALLAGSALVLAACGGGGGSNDSGTAQWRVLNLNAELPSVDVYTGTDKRFSAVASDGLAAYAGIDSGSYTVRVTAAGNPTSLLSQTFSLTKDKHYTGVVWGRSGSVRFATLPEDDATSDIAVNNARLRIYNATSDAGVFDVYLTQPADDLADATPTVAAAAAAALGGYRDVSAGTYRLRVTGTGDSNDVRLDIPSITLAAQTYSTLIITGSPGGVLVNGTLLAQQGAVTPLKNTLARLRAVAGANANGSVSVQLDGTTFAAGLRSPTIGAYQRVTAGSRAVNVLVNGSSVSSTARTLAAGGDYTLVTYGSGQTLLVADDNRLPAASRVRMRLINAAAGTDPLTLSVDLAALVSDVASGTASVFATSNTNSSAQIDITSTSGITPIYTATDVNLQSQGVYTAFVLGGNPAPTGVLRKDR
jgi:hypothetical protein